MRGFSSVYWLAGSVTLAAGGSAAVAVAFGLANLPWAVAAVVGIVLVAAMEGAAKIGVERDAARAELSDARAVQAVTSGALPRGPLPQTIKGTTVNIALHGPAIYARSFINCKIVGPAVVHIEGGDLSRCEWHGDYDVQNPDPAFAVTPIPLIGALRLINCRFDGCQFHGVTAVGTQQEIARLRASFLNLPKAMGADRRRR